MPQRAGVAPAGRKAESDLIPGAPACEPGGGTKASGLLAPYTNLQDLTALPDLRENSGALAPSPTPVRSPQVPTFSAA